jgi:phosphatidylglycerol---prolipoprotein diacylglyceryl transferase
VGGRSTCSSTAGSTTSARGSAAWGSRSTAASSRPPSASAAVWRQRLSVAYLDAIAAGLPLGIAVGRIGDIINGEHCGPATDFFLGVRNTHPDALTPSREVAYHSGGLYEVPIAAIVFAIAWPLRKRLTRPLVLMWLVIALFAVGRFCEFFLRSDSAELALGLEIAQWTSLLLLAVAAAGAWLTLRPTARAEGAPAGEAPPPAGLRAATN